MMAVKSWLRFDAVINLGLVMPSSRRAWMNIGKSFKIVTMLIFYEEKKRVRSDFMGLVWSAQIAVEHGGEDSEGM